MKSQSKFLLGLGVLCLVIIFFVVLTGTLQGRYSFFLKRQEGSIVLGISDKLPIKNISTGAIENILEDTMTSAKSELTKKVASTESTLKTTIEKEVSELTSAQIRAIKLKVCQDWGVVPTSSVKESE